MNDKYLKLFGLNNDSTIEDIKKAYYRLAKQHHPDRFTDENDKKKQEKIMAGISEVYNNIISEYIAAGGIRYSGSQVFGDQAAKETDYTLYKKGMEFYKIYFDSFFQVFHKREVVTPLQKKNCLNNARAFFDRLMLEYPSSEWAFDAGEKLKKINKAIEYLE